MSDWNELFSEVSRKAEAKGIVAKIPTMVEAAKNQGGKFPDMGIRKLAFLYDGKSALWYFLAFFTGKILETYTDDFSVLAVYVDICCREGNAKVMKAVSAYNEYRSKDGGLE